MLAWKSISVALLAVALSTGAARCADLVGVASVIDGDTIEIHGQRVRLFGVDAPETRQLCAAADGREWRCGTQAARALDALVGRASVRCVSRGQDRYRRLVAVCFLGGQDVAESMVAQGLAVAYRRYSQDYVSAENAARRASLGIWAGAFEMPWDWRRSH